MNADAHVAIARGALQALPTAWRELLQPHAHALFAAANYPDLFDDPTRPEADKDAIDPQWRRYTRFPDRLAAQAMHFWPTPIFDQEHACPMLAHLLGSAIAAWRDGLPDDACKFLGCLSHYLGDVTQPAHLMDLELLAQLLPRPDGFATFHYHTTVEAVTGDCLALAPPRLLGLDVAEAVWRLALANREAIRYSRQFVVPTVQALFARDQAEAERLAAFPVTRAAQLTADLLYTALVIATEGATPAEREGLATVDLRLLAPDAAFHDSVYGGALLDASRDVPPNSGPLSPARLRDRDGKLRLVVGLGVLPHSGMCGPRETWMRYALPPGSYALFAAEVGMHAELTRDGAADFVVELDGREVFRSGRLTAADAACPVRVPLGHATSLTLTVVDANEGRTFWHNHAIWAAPRLVRLATHP